MNTKPMEVSQTEMIEIAEYEPLWELWGVENKDDMLAVLQQSYCVRFNFTSGSPGYCGDLFIIQGDALTDSPPVELARDKHGKLQRVEYELM